MRLGIFGGGFDPPHLGHAAVAEEVRDVLNLDDLLWVPSFRPPHKLPEASFDDRCNMVISAVGNASTIEENLVSPNGRVYTIDVVKHYQHFADEIVLVVGVDQFNTFRSWKDPEGVASRAQIAIVGRNGASLNPENLIGSIMRYHFVSTPAFGISSTDIRERIRSGRSIRHLVHPEVEWYIRDHGLYRKNASDSRMSTIPSVFDYAP